MNLQLTSKLGAMTTRLVQSRNTRFALAAIAAAAVTGAVYAAGSSTAVYSGGVAPTGAGVTNVQTAIGGVLDLVILLISGPLGKILAMVCLLAGAAAGAIKRDFVWLLVGGFMALALGYGPGFVDALFTAAI